MAGLATLLSLVRDAEQSPPWHLPKGSLHPAPQGCPYVPLVDGPIHSRQHWVPRELSNCSCPPNFNLRVDFPSSTGSEPVGFGIGSVEVPAKMCRFKMHIGKGYRSRAPLIVVAGSKNTLGFTALEMERDSYGFWDADRSAVARALHKKAAAGEDIVMVDIGANVGFASLAFAIQYPTARVYSYELNPGTFAALKLNIQANGLEERVHAFNRGISGDGKPIPFSRCGATIGQGSQVMKSEAAWKVLNVTSWQEDGLINGGSPGFRQGLEALAACRRQDDSLVDIPSITLEEVITNIRSATGDPAARTPTVDFLKMDCEGCEVSEVAPGRIVLDDLSRMLEQKIIRHAKGECHTQEFGALCKRLLLQ